MRELEPRGEREKKKIGDEVVMNVSGKKKKATWRTWGIDHATIKMTNESNRRQYYFDAL